MNISEATIACNIHKFAQEPEPEETHTHVFFLDHPLVQEAEFHMALPIKNATVDDLRQHMCQMRTFRDNGWQPDEMGNIRVPLCGDDVLDDFRTLHLFQTPEHPDSDDDEDMATRAGIDESDPEGEGV